MFKIHAKNKQLMQCRHEKKFSVIKNVIEVCIGNNKTVLFPLEVPKWGNGPFA